MELELPAPIGVLAEGDISTLDVVCADIRFQIGEILIIKHPSEFRYFLFRVMNYQNILRSIRDMTELAANFLKNREAYIARVESDKLVKVHGLLMGYSEYDADQSKWEFKKPRILPPHFAEVYRGSECQDALSDLLEDEIGKDIEVGKLLIGTSSMEIPIKINLESLPMHVQVAGTTGAGKSFFMLTFITSALKTNLTNWALNKDIKDKVSVFMVDVHDEYMKGLPFQDKRKGIVDVANSVLKGGNDHYDALFGDKFYLTRDLEAIPTEMQKIAKAIRFRRQDLYVSDITSVMTVSDQMLGFMNRARGIENDWITKIDELDDTETLGFAPGTVSAVKRRLYPIIKSPIFTKDEYSDLAEIIYNMEQGHFYNFSTALLSSSEQFVVITMVARTLFALRQALMSSTKWAQFKEQVYSKLPLKIAQELLGETANSKYSIKDLYVIGKDKMKTVDQLPIVMITVEEAPSILGSQMSKEGNVFIDISRQGRKFRIGLLLITQNISSMEPIILANTNTELNMMLGNEIEIRMAILNASNNIAGFENEFKVLSRGEAILTNSLRNVPLPVKVSNVPLYIEQELPFFEKPFEKLKIKKTKTQSTEVPL
ncbi:MAG: ATP-binding protein [Candidatus Heimdallarchaeaceae archaeon]